MPNLFILGASGHGKVIADIAEALGKWESIYFFDDAFPEKTSLGRYKIIGDTEALLKNHQGHNVVVGIGNNDIRRMKHRILAEHNVSFATLIHPSAVVSNSASIGVGTVVMPRAVINSDSWIGISCIINTSSVVEHDCKINNFAHLSPNACLGGQVNVGEAAWVGLGSSIKHLVSIGDNATVGVGAAVVKNVVAHDVVVGVPAKSKI